MPHTATMPNATGLRIAGVRKSFREGKQEISVLSNIDLHLAPGEMVSIMGSSGAGKTTLLRCIAGLESYNSGTITLDGRPMAAGDLGYVFQKPVLYPHLSVRQNILFGTQLKGFAGAADPGHYDLLLNLLDLTGLEGRRPSELSGGQAQRVGIARALMRKPPVVLFDEPLSSVDEELSAHIRSDLLTLHKQLGFSSIFITHDQNEALQLGNRVGVLVDGRLVQIDTPRELVRNPRSLAVAELTGHPKFNSFPARLAGQEITVGFRSSSPQTKKPAQGAAPANKLQVRLGEKRSLTSGVLYTARTVHEASWSIDGQNGVQIPAGTKLEFMEALETTQTLCGEHTLYINENWCFAFDPSTQKRLNLAHQHQSL